MYNLLLLFFQKVRTNGMYNKFYIDFVCKMYVYFVLLNICTFCLERNIYDVYVDVLYIHSVDFYFSNICIFCLERNIYGVYFDVIYIHSVGF